MAMTKCERHEFQGMVLVCSDITKAVADRENIENVIRLSLVSTSSDNPFESMESDFYYCSLCAETKGLPSENSELPDSEYEKIVEKDFKGVCIKCFKEVRKYND